MSSIIEPKGKPPHKQVVKTLTDYLVNCGAAATADSITSITILVSGKHSTLKFNGSNEFHETIIINNRMGFPIPEKEIKEFFEKLYLHFANNGTDQLMKDFLEKLIKGIHPDQVK